MIPVNIIVHIIKFILLDPLYLLDKDIYNSINNFNKSKKWYKIYRKYFSKNNIKLDPVNYSLLNWKKEYLRIKNFKFWNLIKIENNSLYINNKNFNIIPKELGNLINLRQLLLYSYKVKEIGFIKSRSPLRSPKGLSNIKIEL